MWKCKWEKWLRYQVPLLPLLLLNEQMSFKNCCAYGRSKASASNERTTHSSNKEFQLKGKSGRERKKYKLSFLLQRILNRDGLNAEIVALAVGFKPKTLVSLCNGSNPWTPQKHNFSGRYHHNYCLHSLILFLPLMTGKHWFGWAVNRVVESCSMELRVQSLVRMSIRKS